MGVLGAVDEKRHERMFWHHWSVSVAPYAGESSTMLQHDEGQETVICTKLEQRRYFPFFVLAPSLPISQVDKVLFRFIYSMLLII